MVASTPVKAPQLVTIKRLPWMHRIQLYSPKAARMLVLFSYDSLAAWALAESCPLVDAFCEYPGYVNVDGTRVMADLWVRGCGREQYVKIEGGIDLSSERPDQVPTFADLEVARVSSDWLLRYQVWIDNWLQINPYLVANARFVTHGHGIRKPSAALPALPTIPSGSSDGPAAVRATRQRCRQDHAMAAATGQVCILVHAGPPSKDGHNQPRGWGNDRVPPRKTQIQGRRQLGLHRSPAGRDACAAFDAINGLEARINAAVTENAGPPCALQCVAALLQQRPLAQLPHPGIPRPVRPVRSVSRGPSAR